MSHENFNHNDLHNAAHQTNLKKAIMGLLTAAIWIGAIALIQFLDKKVSPKKG